MKLCVYFTSLLLLGSNNKIRKFIFLFSCFDPEKLLMKVRSQGGIKALLGIVRCGHPDVLSQVARGIANFAKCESRASSQGLFSCCFLGWQWFEF